MITIINYGVGNIKALVSVLKFLAVPYVIADEVKHIKQSSKLILPGVGSFDHAIQSFNHSGLRDEVERSVFDKKIPLLGICVGMQMFAKKSEEGLEAGLGWIDAEVIKFNSAELEGTNAIKIPHMGWNNLHIQHQNVPILDNLQADPYFYFLHSYFMKCNNTSNVVAYSKYGGEFVSVVNEGNLNGVQFHPEKSHENGVALIDNFVNL